MKLSQQQINSLITGIALAAEIPASSSKLRHFVVIKGYAINEHGKIYRLSNVLDSSKAQTKKSSKSFQTYCLCAAVVGGGYSVFSFP